MTQVRLILLFDGGCPLCQREVNFLRSRDKFNYISFVDIDSPNFKPELFGGISYRKAMGRIHAITSSGEVLKDVQVFQEAYRLVGMGWVYAPTTWPLFGFLADQFYVLWARLRLRLTGRQSLDAICKARESNLN